MPANNLTPRTAILGIGQELRGDDALGLEIARRLQKKLSGREDVLILLAGPAPENFTGALRRFAPQRVILVDAALMGEPPRRRPLAGLARRWRLQRQHPQPAPQRPGRLFRE